MQDFLSRYTGSKAGPAEEPHDAADVEEGELREELRAHAHDDDEDRARTPLPSIMPTPVPHRPFHSLDRSHVLQLRRAQELETGWEDTRICAHTPELLPTFLHGLPTPSYSVAAIPSHLWPVATNFLRDEAFHSWMNAYIPAKNAGLPITWAMFTTCLKIAYGLPNNEFIARRQF